MKNIYLLLFLFLALQARGQYFSPFRPGVLAQYSTAAGDTTTILQLDKRTRYVPGIGSVVGRDSLYSFVLRTKPLRSGCGYYRLGGGLFGDVMGIDYPNSYKATYRLYGNYNSTYQDYDVELLLKPYAPLNQVWNATYQQTARVVSRTVQPVLGVPDSVVTIAFSGGQQLHLSKFHGLVDGPALTYFAGNNPARRFSLTALPRQHLGQPVMGALAVYDFQPGDRLVYNYYQYTFNTAPNAPAGLNYLYSDSVLSRLNSRTGDTVTYRVARYSQQSGTTTINTLRYFATGTIPRTQPSQRFVAGPVIAPTALRMGVLFFDAVRSTVYPAGRAVQKTENLLTCSGSTPADTFYVSRRGVEIYSGNDYATGLGSVRYYNNDTFGTTTIISLVGYRKGIETWGNLSRMAFAPLATAASRPAATTVAFPNPFGAELAVAFALARPQAVGLTLHDALGRIVLTQPAMPQAAGARQLTLATAGLPAGLYTLHLHFAEDGRTEVLKVLKAN